MATILCDVTPGIRDTEKTVSFSRPAQLLRVQNGYIRDIGGQQYLPVGVVGRDESKNLALIELPHESDSGVDRLWVSLAELK